MTGRLISFLHSMVTLCSIGINHSWLVGFFMFYYMKFSWFGWSTFSTIPKPGWNGRKNTCMIMLCDNTSRNDSSQGLPHFNQKQIGKCSIEKHQLCQPKLVAVHTVDPKRSQPRSLCSIKPNLKYAVRI